MAWLNQTVIVAAGNVARIIPHGISGLCRHGHGTVVVEYHVNRPAVGHILWTLRARADQTDRTCKMHTAGGRAHARSRRAGCRKYHIRKGLSEIHPDRTAVQVPYKIEIEGAIGHGHSRRNIRDDQIRMGTQRNGKENRVVRGNVEVRNYMKSIGRHITEQLHDLSCRILKLNTVQYAARNSGVRKDS